MLYSDFMQVKGMTVVIMEESWINSLNCSRLPIHVLVFVKAIRRVIALVACDMTTEQQREVLRLIAGRKLRIEQMRQRKDEQLGFDFEEIPEIGELFWKIINQARHANSILKMR